MAMIAYKCPDIEVVVVDINAARIAAWNSEVWLMDDWIMEDYNNATTSRHELMVPARTMPRRSCLSTSRSWTRSSRLAGVATFSSQQNAATT